MRIIDPNRDELPLYCFTSWNHCLLWQKRSKEPFGVKVNWARLHPYQDEIAQYSLEVGNTKQSKTLRWIDHEQGAFYTYGRIRSGRHRVLFECRFSCRGSQVHAESSGH